jgi:hypothetical protein
LSGSMPGSSARMTRVSSSRYWSGQDPSAVP